MSSAAWMMNWLRCEVSSRCARKAASKRDAQSKRRGGRAAGRQGGRAAGVELGGEAACSSGEGVGDEGEGTDGDSASARTEAEAARAELEWRGAHPLRVEELRLVDRGVALRDHHEHVVAGHGSARRAWAPRIAAPRTGCRSTRLFAPARHHAARRWNLQLGTPLPLASSRGAHSYPSPNAVLTRTQAAAKKPTP
jgi:hypothetical protein